MAGLCQSFPKYGCSLTILNGVIKTLTDRGFGFIWPDSEERDYFFHSMNLQDVAFDDLKVGQAVTFELFAGKKGPEAHRINRLGDPPKLSTSHELPAKPPDIVIRALQDCSTELLEYLTEHPYSLRDLHPGAFENLVAAIFRNEGFAVERISGWNEPDGGVDLIAVRHLSPGFDVRLAVQCKRWAQPRKLSAEPLRSLAGILDRFQAHAGVVATTGFFSEKAEEERTRYLWRISYRDYNDILASLNRLRLINSYAACR